MEPCGYVVAIHVWDRTIINSGPGKRRSKDDEGFCLIEPS